VVLGLREQAAVLAASSWASQSLNVRGVDEGASAGGISWVELTAFAYVTVSVPSGCTMSR
jgi:hypothetical protein